GGRSVRGKGGGWGEAGGKADKADPAATQLLAEARAARALWENFPGFTADVEVNLDGQVTRGRVEVSPKGKLAVTLEGKDVKDAETWLKRELGSTVGHRMGGGPTDTPCAFADEDVQNPLGRAVRVLNDEFHSSYRIRDRQIVVVNRQMEDERFTITVLENRVNEDKQYLPACFVVNTWDAKSGVLRSAAAYHHTWQRVGKFDLP